MPSISSKNPSTEPISKINSIENIFCYLLLVIFFGAGIYLRWEALQSVTIGGHEWITRDFDRAFNIIDGIYIPLAGPESNAGGRLPGPFMYFWLAIPLLFHYSYEAIFNFNFILNIISIVGLFFILKRHFNLFTSALAVGMLGISAHHISAVNHPINPAFIFPFITVFIGLYFELIFKEKIKVIPWIVLVLSLSVQFHYSMAVYALVPISVTYLYKIRPTKKIIIKSIIVGILVFSPYMMFKLQTFEPTNDGSAATFRRPNITILEILKAVSLQSTLHRITHSSPFPKIENKITPQIRQILLSAVFYTFIVWVALSVKKNSLKPYKKEISILALFIIPALTYEIVHPFTQHYWYSFVFIIPTVLLIATFVYNVKLIIPFNWSKTIISILAFALLVSHFTTSYEEIKRNNKKLKRDLTWGTYRNSKLFLSELMKTLERTPQEIYEQVYFLDFHPSSLRRLEFAYLSTNKKSSIKKDHKKKCFFVGDVLGLSLKGKRFLKVRNRTSWQLASQRLGLFLNDSSINRLKSLEFSFGNYGFPIVYEIIPYIPKEKQSCYANSFNPFVTTKEIRDLLREVKLLHKSTNKKTYLREEYDQNDQLLSFSGKYIINNPFAQTPFRFSLSIKKLNTDYYAEISIDNYYFWGQRNFRLDILKLYLVDNISNLDSDLKRFSHARANYKNSIKLTILPRGTLLSSVNHLRSWGHWSYNKNFTKKLKLPEEMSFKKNEFYFDLGYEIGAEEELKLNNTGVMHYGFINLKSPN